MRVAVRMIVVVIMAVAVGHRLGQNSTHERKSFSERLCRNDLLDRTATYLASSASTSAGCTSWPVWLLHEFFV